MMQKNLVTISEKTGQGKGDRQKANEIFCVLIAAGTHERVKGAAKTSCFLILSAWTFTATRVCLFSCSPSSSIPC
jgi:hypothetical protein